MIIVPQNMGSYKYRDNLYVLIRAHVRFLPPRMDVIGLVAASAQLIGYCYSVTKALLGVFKSINEGPSAYNDQKANIRLLLIIVSRLSEHPVESDEDRDIILSLIIDISNIASRTRQLLEEESSFLKKIWNWSGNRPEIAAAFNALSAKRELLQLIVAHNNTAILSNITRHFRTGNARQPSSCNDKSMGCIASRPTMDSEINANSAKVYNHSTIEIAALSDEVAALGIQKIVGTIRRKVNAAGATVQDWSRIGMGRTINERSRKDKMGSANVLSHITESYTDRTDVSELPSSRGISYSLPELESPRMTRTKVNGAFPSRAKLPGSNLVFAGYDSP
ncbi:uncharacterized protein F4807DRAFT_469340 [Annulohypoxylon truncatum]|uniref:uncharacterized protein n=1 Tax=Annulohypoxylon truncatum TaxID=327061 RepID=UPI002007D017|nr:uncharacterized protein F4807DRAFT_469340 [Annulohypoxylon truncatum]KAI1207549.1 hypothetical protein F4807DRAFT_469340 [Annulohypoxylon truncatum]